jgi:hypothetical protein
MRDWLLWILMGIALAVAILLCAILLGLARLVPSLARRLARSGLAVGVLATVWDVTMAVVQPGRD